MARKFKVSRKIHELEKKLFSSTFWVEVNKGMGQDPTLSKVAAYDAIFSLSVEEQAVLFAYRAQKAKAVPASMERWDMSPDEIANAMGYDTWEDFELTTLGRNIDIAKMVSLLTDGHGQQSNDGRRLKAQLEKLFNDRIERDLFEIID